MGAVPSAVAEADRIIERLAGKVDAVVVGRNAQVDRRKGAGEGVEAREQPAGREGADDAALPRLAEAADRILVTRRGDAENGRASCRERGMCTCRSRGSAAD